MLGKWKGKTGQKSEKDVAVSDSVYVCVGVSVSVGVSVVVYGITCNANEAPAYAFASERKDIHHASGPELWTFG